MSTFVARKLTTILAADAERFSAAMEADEVGTYSALKAARAVFFKLIERHGGRVANTAGDGLIADFPSVVEATHCAIEVQQELAAKDGALRFRIGIHLGDVICDGEDLLGDGVNLAARLQTMAEPGGILISRQVYDQVHNKLTIGFEYLGEKHAKNLPDEISVYRITTAEAGAAKFEKLRPKVKAKSHAQTSEHQDRVAHVWDDDFEDFDAKSHAPDPDNETPSRLDQFALESKTQKWFVFGVGGAVLLNLITGGGFWPAWPILAFALLFGLRYGERAMGFKTYKSIPVRIWVLVLFLIGVNVMSFSGPWAVFPVGALLLGSWLLYKQPTTD
ncbi:adenylate/guanylate cyclase domain-containing protein [Epibacterium ulvae]|uniref:adenylate/guanylate cyclase domain-containing protein n=1 Tax=Epibacterium ulvae TaxID=1156985 RepID=UPI001BFC88C3|nr:adenylate/guanylate cyclase domain-containing protein [Epibacterium ulvae]MBT8155380.1 adenylate/guanylate cyclase domain-containing protein [Epibacterium ulvae]